MAERGAAGPYVTAMTPALRVFAALADMRDGDQIEVQFPPDLMNRLGDWAAKTLVAGEPDIRLRPPWAYEYDAFTWPDIVGYLQHTGTPRDPASFAVVSNDAGLALHAPIADVEHVTCLVHCVNIAHVYGLPDLPLTIVTATLAATAVRMPALRPLFPPLTSGADTEFDRNVYLL